ncbi:MAG: exosome complex exonuclease Rrp41 [Candidatus Micrarchaeota archaeon]
MEKPVLIKNGKRLDGRGIEDLRPLSIKVGVLKKADGSAMIEWGKNKIMAAVYGPREVFPKHLTNVNRALINCRYSMAPFSSLEEHGRSGPNRRAIEIGKVTKHVFENIVLVNQFPKTQIDIMIDVLQSDGGTRIAGVTAAAVALADAGIPMKDLIQGVSVGKIEGVMVVDVDKPEDNFGESDIPIVVSLRSKEILLFQLDGMLKKEEIEQAIEFAFRASEKVKAVQVAALKEKYLSSGENGA